MIPDGEPATAPLYRDQLVCITGSAITFVHYSFPLLAKKEVPLAGIDFIEARVPSVANGKWRIWGSGNLTTWFPLDASRPRRDRIFVATIRGRRTKIGFTVEDSARVIALLRSRGIDVRE